MNRSLSELKGIERKDLIQRLIHAEYAFAQWRMPHANEEVLIVSMDPPKKTSTDVSNLDSGFLINKFSDNHPGSPYLIKADIIFEKNTIKADPRINASEWDQLATSLKKKNAQHPTIPPPAPSGDDFQSTVSQAIAAIKENKIDKVVLSRYKDVVLSPHFSPDAFFSRMAEKYPDAFCNMVFIPSEGLWMGATPELLLSDNTSAFHTLALAGTKPLNEGQALTEIAWTQKEIEEQAMVSRYIIDCFKKIRLREFKEVGPKTSKAGNLAHLKTMYEVDYSQVSFENLADQMLELLHPTSAVCGMPITSAKGFIAEHEPFDRSFFAGFLGPVNFKESTNLFVNLRCMNVQEGYARLYAGAGITEDSDPEKEWLETELKMATLGSLIG